MTDAFHPKTEFINGKGRINFVKIREKCYWLVQFFKNLRTVIKIHQAGEISGKQTKWHILRSNEEIE